VLDWSSAVKRWRIAPPVPPHIRDRLGTYSPIMAQILYNRGQDTPDKVHAFLQGGDQALHNPFQMIGMNKAVARIRHAIKQGELIAVYGDFDADGVTSTALMTQALEALDGRVMPYIPNRVDEGYGVNNAALQYLHDAGVKLVITVDCGIRSIEEVQYGNELGLDMIVTDHHSVGDQLPPALAVIDPKIDAKQRIEEGKTNGYPEDMLAGVGVAYKLADALFRATQVQGRSQPKVELESLLDLVALGTVADLAPLDRLENRELVRRGLKVLNKAQRPGIYHLIDVAGLEPGKISATSIGFMLAPRINAAGRLSDAMIAYRLLVEGIPAVEQLAQDLQALNVQRQDLTKETVELAKADLDDGDIPPLIFSASEQFKSGIVGLVAGRLCEEYYRPAVVLEHGAEESRGSCRSVPEFDITAALDRCADLLVRHGGHAQAAGFTVRNENIPLLHERLLGFASEALRGEELRPMLEIDAEIALSDVTENLAQSLESLEPTGARNDTPLFLTRRLQVVDARRVGQEGKHLRLRLSNGASEIECIAFKQGDWAEHLPSLVDVVYHLEFREWNGRRQPKLVVEDLQPSGDL
jgi:single-stranded-DNA-specific exonuclease